MNKGLLGKVSLLSLLVVALIAILIFIIPVFSLPAFTSSTTQNNNTQYSPAKNFGFQINITDDTDIIRNISKAFFETNITTGTSTLMNITSDNSSVFTTFTNDTTGLWWINFTQNLTKGANTYVFKWYANNTTNVWSSSAQEVFIILKGDTSVTLTLNETTSSQTSTYPNSTINVTAVSNISGVFVQLWKNGTLISNTSSSATNTNLTEAGNINFTAQVLGNANYSDSTPVTIWWNISKGSTTATLTLNDTTLSNQSSTYPNSTINASASSSIAGLYVRIFHNGTLFENATTGGVWNMTQWSVGNSSFDAIVLGNQNYSDSSNATVWWNVNKGSTTTTLTLNDTTTSQTSTYPNSTINASASSSVSGLYVRIFLNGTSIENATTGGVWNMTQWSAGDNNFTAQVLGNANYSDSSPVTIFWNISKASTTATLTLNGTTSSQTSTYPNSTINASASSSIAGLYVQIRDNSTSIENAITGGAWNMTQFSGGNHNFSAQVLGNQNYSDSSLDSVWWNVSKGTITNVVAYINNTTTNQTITYLATIEIRGNYTAVITPPTFNLYANNTLLASGNPAFNSSVVLGAGVNRIYYNTSGDENWTSANNNTYNLTVNKAVLTGSIAGSNVTLPLTTTILPSESNTGDADVNYTLWRDTNYETSTWGNSSFSAVSTQPTADTWTYKLNTTGDTFANWTANSSIATLVITVAAASSTAGSSGGSSTSSTIATPSIRLGVGKTNITLATLTTSGKMIATIARYQDVDIRGMNITVVNNVANIKIMITKLASLPSSVSYDITGTAYHYINIEKTNMTDSDIKQINLTFAVNKTWLTNNGIATSNITLYRWANNKWNDLGAIKISEDTAEAFYTASSPGLSVFVIGTKGIQAEAPVTPAACTESWSCTDWSTCTGGTQTRTCTDSNSCGTTTSKPAESQSCQAQAVVTPPTIFSTLSYVIVIVIAIIVCVLIFLERAKITSYFQKSSKKK